jgi:hypothetical protein
VPQQALGEVDRGIADRVLNPEERTSWSTKCSAPMIAKPGWLDFDEATALHTLTVTSLDGDQLLHGTVTTDQLTALARQLSAGAGAPPGDADGALRPQPRAQS